MPILKFLHTARVMKSKSAKGVIFSLLSFFCFAVMGALVKKLGPIISTPQILFFQNLIGLITIFFFLLFNKGTTLRTKCISLHLFRSFMGAAGMYFMFYSISLISLTNVILFTYTASLWIPIIVWLLFRQRVSKFSWVGVFIGFVGIILILEPNGQVINHGSLIAILSGICLAFVLITIRHLSITETTERILFYTFLFSSLVFFPFAVYTWRELTLQAIFYIIGISCSLIFSQAFIAIAYRYSTAVDLAPFIYSSVVFAGIINWLSWAQLPTLLEIFGILFVISGGIFTMFSPKH